MNWRDVIKYNIITFLSFGGNIDFGINLKTSGLNYCISIYTTWGGGENTFSIPLSPPSFSWAISAFDGDVLLVLWPGDFSSWAVTDLLQPFGDNFSPSGLNCGGSVSILSQLLSVGNDMLSSDFCTLCFLPVFITGFQTKHPCRLPLTGSLGSSRELYWCSYEIFSEFLWSAECKSTGALHSGTIPMATLDLLGLQPNRVCFRCELDVWA